MTARKRIPSKAQAKLLAELWGRDKGTPIGAAGEDRTKQICVEHGWLAATSLEGTFPNGTPFKMYITSEAGLLALENFLMEARFKNIDLAKSIK